MDDDARNVLRSLVTESRVLSVAVEVDDGPYAALLPFAVRPDGGAFLVHVSGLAAHTRGLEDGAPFGLVIHRPDDGTGDPLQVPRVMLQGRTRRLARGGDEHARGRDAYVAKFPASAPIFGLGDFVLCELVPERGRLVTGFAGATNVGPRALAEAVGGAGASSGPGEPGVP